MFVVCMGKQSDSVFGHCDLARPRSLLTRGSGHVAPVFVSFVMPLCGSSDLGARRARIASTRHAHLAAPTEVLRLQAPRLAAGTTFEPFNAVTFPLFPSRFFLLSVDWKHRKFQGAADVCGWRRVDGELTRHGGSGRFGRWRWGNGALCYLAAPRFGARPPSCQRDGEVPFLQRPPPSRPTPLNSLHAVCPVLLCQDALQESKGASEAAIDTLQREVRTPAPTPAPPCHHSTPTIPP